jgi:bacillopeptidase F
MFPADKTGSHGTHTLGTTLGLDAATHDTIGVAYNAYWICSDPVATSLATVKPLSDFMYAFEWAINPDGDTNTVWDIPDAINNSWGYGVATDTLLCDSYVSQVFLAVEAAGIANVFSAGNEGPGDTTISIPHHLNTNIVLSCAVGALDGNNPSYPIASFSSRGPTVCGGSGSLLIKPEVSAPGVDVRSCILDSSYAYYSGTSMAGPHVTGAVLLLKEAFPFLPGHDILEALYYTATDLGVPGEDNTYGMGLINLQAAFDFLDSLYTPALPDSNSFDAAITAFTAPIIGDHYCDSLITPEVQLTNAATDTLFNGTFHVTINNGIEYTQLWTGSLAAGQSVTVTLMQVAIAGAPYNEMKVWFEADTSMHESSFINNHRMLRFYYRPTMELPFIEEFEQGIDSVLWRILNPNYNLTWDTLHTSGLPFSAISAVMHFNEALTNNQLDHLITPSFNFSGPDSVYLSFDVAYQNIHPVLSDSLKIYLSTDCGMTFPNIVYRKGGQTLQTFDTITEGFVPWRSDQWRHEVVDLSAFTGQTNVMLRFTGHNKRGNNLFIDNIKIYSGNEPASIFESNSLPWQVYPNPAKEQLSFANPYAEATDVRVQLFDISGKCHYDEVILMPVDQTRTIDLKDFQQGLYFIRFSCRQEVSVTRFVIIK